MLLLDVSGISVVLRRVHTGLRDRGAGICRLRESQAHSHHVNVFSLLSHIFVPLRMHSKAGVSNTSTQYSVWEQEKSRPYALLSTW